MQVQHQIHPLVGDELFDALDGEIVRVVFPDGFELAVHVPVSAPGTVDDGLEIEVGHDPDRAGLDAIERGQQRGGAESTRFVALDAAEDQQRGARSSGFELVHREVERAGGEDRRGFHSQYGGEY